MVMLLCACSGENKATEGLEFTFRNGSDYITGYHGTEVDVVIPDTYNDVPVTEIVESAFFHCSSLAVVKIPKDALVGWRAFDGCPAQIAYK